MIWFGSVKRLGAGAEGVIDSSRGGIFSKIQQSTLSFIPPSADRWSDKLAVNVRVNFSEFFLAPFVPRRAWLVELLGA